MDYFIIKIIIVYILYPLFKTFIVNFKYIEDMICIFLRRVIKAVMDKMFCSKKLEYRHINFIITTLMIVIISVDIIIIYGKISMI